MLRIGYDVSEVPPALGTSRLLVSRPLGRARKLIRRFQTSRVSDLLAVLLDGRCGRIFAACLGKNGAVLHPLLARRIIRRIAGMLARAHRRRAWTWLPGLIGGLGQRRRGAEDRYGREDD